MEMQSSMASSLVSILLSQWIWLEVSVLHITKNGQGMFQSFWVNGFGWKGILPNRFQDYQKVSILLSQWIWLEVAECIKRKENQLKFQSFWVNGFGWKMNHPAKRVGSELVSILLSQWIWLEAIVPWVTQIEQECFNPSESMDLVGSLAISPASPINALFQSFWVNGFGWKWNWGRKGKEV